MNLLQKEFSPFIKPDSYEIIQENHKLYCEEAYLKHYNCKECNEFCILEYEVKGEQLVSYCPDGHLEDEIIIPKEELKRYNFKISRFLKILAGQNSIYFHKNQINKEIILFGEKELNGTTYKFFYIINAFQENKIREEIIYKLKEWLSPEERALIITPAFIIADKQFYSYLQENKTEIIFLKDLLANDLRILSFIKSDIKNIENLISAYDLVIIDESQIYLYKNQLNLPKMAFRLLNFIVLKGKEGLSASYDDCIEYVWQDCKNENIDYPKQLKNHRSDINESFKKADITDYKSLIKAENQSYKLIIAPEKIFII